MHDACRRGNMEALEECLMNRVPVNLGDRSGNTPLHWAAHSGQLVCVERLLGTGHLFIAAKNRLGDSPLHHVNERRS